MVAGAACTDTRWWWSRTHSAMAAWQFITQAHSQSVYKPLKPRNKQIGLNLMKHDFKKNQGTSRRVFLIPLSYTTLSVDGFSSSCLLAGATFSWIIVCVGKWVGLCNTSPSPFPPASPPRWHFRGMPRKGSPRGTVKKRHNPEQPWGCSELHHGLNLPPASLRIRGVHTVWHSLLSPHPVVNWLILKGIWEWTAYS